VSDIVLSYPLPGPTETEETRIVRSPFSPSARASHVGSIDIGGSHVTAAIVDHGPTPRIIERSTFPIDTHGSRDALLGTIDDAVRPLAAGATRWVVALPGPFDYAQGVGSFEGVGKFQSLAGVDLRGTFAAMLGVNGQLVTFANDAIAYGMGEWSVSQSRPPRFLCVTLGTGIGSAFLDRGRAVESGPDVPPHGWVHLLTIAGAPLEDTVSTRAILRSYSDSDILTVRDIAERARSGEQRARVVLATAMDELGQALAPWVQRFGATEVVVGGSMSRSWDVLGPALTRGIVRGGYAPAPVAVRASILFDDAPLIGAAMHLREIEPGPL
jgi:glucokinase